MTLRPLPVGLTYFFGNIMGRSRPSVYNYSDYGSGASWPEIGLLPIMTAPLTMRITPVTALSLSHIRVMSKSITTPSRTLDTAYISIQVHPLLT